MNTCDPCGSGHVAMKIRLSSLLCDSSKKNQSAGHPKFESLVFSTQFVDTSSEFFFAHALQLSNNTSKCQHFVLYHSVSVP